MTGAWPAQRRGGATAERRWWGEGRGLLWPSPQTGSMVRSVASLSSDDHFDGERWREASAAPALPKRRFQRWFEAYTTDATRNRLFDIIHSSFS